MNMFDLINTTLPSETTSQYIDFYFHQMVKLNSKREIYFENFDNGYLSIMKDEIDRKLNGSGKLREKPWSNFLFFFINIKDFEILFGTNEKHRDISSIEPNGNFELSSYDYSYYKNPKALYFHRKNNFKIAKFIFDKIKNEKSFLFVRSFVYITIILYGKNEITKNEFLTFYFNTNYKFTETNGKTEFIANVANSYLVKDVNHELAIIEDNNKDIFDCVKAYNDSIEYTNLTSHNLKNIVDSIDEGNEYILIEGSARTGKTIIAMSLLRIYPNSNLLVMNYYFYQALKDAFEALNIHFPYNRIFHQARGKKGYYDNVQSINFDFSIIDECQRLGRMFGLVDRSLSSKTHKHTIFLGDNLQRLMPSSDDGITYIKKRISEENKQLTMFRYTNSVGIPPEILKNIKYLLCDPTIVSPHFLGEYNINIFDDKIKFLKSYKTDNHKNRHIATIHYPVNNFTAIGDFLAFPKGLVNSDYPYFLNKEIISRYYLSPFELISREVESIYVYIRKNINEDNLNNFTFYQLYVLMTRATISLNIFCESDSLRKKFKQRLNDILSYSTMIENNVENCITEGQFEVNETILDEFIQKYNIVSPKDQIVSRGITRLVHFTEESNIPNIIKNGLLPRSILMNNGIMFDYNDKNRWDNHVDSICLSVENPNQWLLEKFKKDYPNKKYKLITINPSILFSSFIKEENIKLTPRLYCNYNAASNMTKSSDSNIDIMFSEKVQTYHWLHTRDGVPNNHPTSTQAEILFFGRIPPEYIESIEEI